MPVWSGNKAPRSPRHFLSDPRSRTLWAIGVVLLITGMVVRSETNYAWGLLVSIAALVLLIWAYVGHNRRRHNTKDHDA